MSEVYLWDVIKILLGVAATSVGALWNQRLNQIARDVRDIKNRVGEHSKQLDSLRTTAVRHGVKLRHVEEEHNEIAKVAREANEVAGKLRIIHNSLHPDAPVNGMKK